MVWRKLMAARRGVLCAHPHSPGARLPHAPRWRAGGRL